MGFNNLIWVTSNMSAILCATQGIWTLVDIKENYPSSFLSLSRKLQVRDSINTNSKNAKYKADFEGKIYFKRSKGMDGFIDVEWTTNQ